jgi:hypothetical protein
MAAMNIETGKLDKAESELERALQIRQKALGENHRDVITILNRLAWVHAMKGDIAQAVSFGSRANEIRVHDIDVNLADTSERQKLASWPACRITESALRTFASLPDPAAAKAASPRFCSAKGCAGKDGRYAQRDAPRWRKDQSLDDWNAATSRLPELFLMTAAPSPRMLARSRPWKQNGKSWKPKSGGGLAGFSRTETLTLAAVQAAIPQSAALLTSLSTVRSIRRRETVSLSMESHAYGLRGTGQGDVVGATLARQKRSTKRSVHGGPSRSQAERRQRTRPCSGR